jgi:intergrase/recombinase
MIAEFINTYGAELLHTALLAIAGYVAAFVKRIVAEHFQDKTKRDLAKTVVQFVEQVYKDLHGDDKLNTALAAFSEMLAEKGITISELEMRMLLEAAVAEFNDAFYKPALISPDQHPAT